MKIRKVEKSDIADVAQLLREAYKIWEPIGVDTSKFTDESVATYMLPDGYLLEIESEIRGAICIRHGVPKIDGDLLTVDRAHKQDTTRLVDSNLAESITGRKFTYFYGLAVDPNIGRQGLGRKLIEFLEEKAREEISSGILLEAGAKTDWLLEWYKGFGFKHIGAYSFGPVELVFMGKFF